MEYVSGNVFIREMKAGDGKLAIHGDQHHFYHTTYGAKGRYLAKARSQDGKTSKEVIIDSRKGQSWTGIAEEMLHDIEQLPNEPYVTSPMLEAAQAAAPNVDRNLVLKIIEASQVADTEGILHCIYSHRTPQVFAEHAGQNAEYDELLDKLTELGNSLFGNIVQRYDGWMHGNV